MNHDGFISNHEIKMYTRSILKVFGVKNVFKICDSFCLRFIGDLIGCRFGDTFHGCTRIDYDDLDFHSAIDFGCANFTFSGLSNG